MPNVTAGNSVTSSSQLNTGVVTTGAILDNTIAKTDVGTGAVGTDEILDGEIVNADINSAAAIALSKMAAGTQGAVLIRTASGVLTETAVGASGQVLKSFGAGQDPAWADNTAPVNAILSTCFETAARFTSSILGGATSSSNTFGTAGLRIYKHYTYGINALNNVMQLVGRASTLYLGSPIFSTRILVTAFTNNVGSIYCGLGNPTVATTGHTWTVGHAGFKIVKSGGVVSLYATQADGSTETASSALTTVADGDELDLMLRINGSSSVDYYWRKNGGSMSSATNLTTNMPAGTSQQAQFSVSCNNSDNAPIDVTFSHASYIR